MASVQVDGAEVEEVSSHVEDKSTNKYCSCEPQNIEKEEHHDYVEEEEEEDPEDLDNITPDHDHEKADEDEEELVQIVDEGEKPTGGIEFSDEEEYLGDD